MAASVLILTLNEETNIANCISSLAWSNDVVVLDSYSTDSTVDIAEKFGARVVQRKFDNWSAHQNWAVSNIEFNNPWVLYLDADERCTPDLAEDMTTVSTQESPYSAFRIRRKDFFMGTWLKHAQLYPTWLVRLFRPERMQYERLVNPVANVSGKVGSLDAHIHHYPFSHGVAHWIARHNRYSDMEAEELLRTRTGKNISINGLLSKDPNEKRSAQKDLFYRLPFRPTIKFYYYYLVRRGFLDGAPGLIYSRLQAMYETMIDVKYRALAAQDVHSRSNATDDS